MFQLENSHFWFIGKRLFIEEYLRSIKHSITKILDIGSGTGGTKKWLSKYGCTIGLEKSMYGIAFGKKRGLTIIPGSADVLPFKKNSFDLVTLLDVLYHKNIFRIEDVLKEAYRVLKPDGYLLITDSAWPFLYGKHDIQMHGKRRFTQSALKKPLHKLHFKVLRSSYLYFFLFPIFVIQRKIIDHIDRKEQSNVNNVNIFINAALIFIVKFEAYLLRIISFPIGSSVVVLAQKK